jgi:ribose 5-phosphate isomerase B
MIISIGADGRLPIVEKLLKSIENRGHTVIWHGPQSVEDGFKPFPLVAQAVTKDIVDGKANEGIIFCYTGTGITIAANKTKGIRAALCFDSYSAKGARLWNDANVLTLSMRLLSDVVMEEILDSWFENKYEINKNANVDEGVRLLHEIDQ